MDLTFSISSATHDALEGIAWSKAPGNVITVSLFGPSPSFCF